MTMTKQARVAEIKQFLITIDLEKLIDVELSLEQFVFLSLVDSKKPELYSAYTSRIKSNIITNPTQITSLIERGLLIQTVPNNFLFNNFKVTDQFYELFENDQSKIIKELKEAYPKQTPSGKRKGLQADQAKWIPKYLNIVKNNNKLHKLILDCINFEVLDREANGQGEFMPMISTYINNRRWETYQEDVTAMLEKGEIIDQINNNNIDDI